MQDNIWTFIIFFFGRRLSIFFRSKVTLVWLGGEVYHGPMKGKCKKDVGKENAEIKVYKKRKKKSGG